MPLSFPRIRKNSLFRQVAVRVLLAMLISGALATALGFWFYHFANDRVTDLRLKRVVEHYTNELTDLELRWGREAYNLKSRLEFSRLLEHDFVRADQLRSFLVAQGGYLEFPLVALADRNGKVIFTYSVGSEETPPVSFPEGSDAIWTFDERTQTLYRVFRQTVWVGNGNGALLLYRPIDNALLLRASDPEATISVLWNDQPLASSGGNSALDDAGKALREQGPEQGQASISWSVNEPGPQPRALLLLSRGQGLSVSEMMLPLVVAGLAFVLIAWALLGRWMVSTLQRLTALERGQLKFVEQRDLGPEVLDQIACARASQADEIARLATALERLMRDVQSNERTLRESEFFFRESQRVAEIGAYTCDFVAGTWKSSDVLDRIFGVGPDYEHTLQSWFDLLHPDDVAAMAHYLHDEVIAGGKPFSRQYRIVRRSDQQIRWVHGNGELGFDGSGKVVTMIGTIQDITELRRTEERLTLAGMVFDSAAEGIVVTDRENHILLANPAYEAITGYPADELRGRNPKMLSSGRQTREFYRAMWTELLNSGQWKGELWNRRKDGELYLQRTSMAIVRDADGRPYRHVSMVYDVTEQWFREQEVRELNATLERRVAERTLSLHESNLQLQETLATLGRAQNDLVHAEKLAALGAVVAGVAHEMNTPIGNSLTVASTLTERTHDIRSLFDAGAMKRSDLAAYLDASDRAAGMLVHSMNRAHELVANFKQVAVDQTSESRRDFDLRTIVEENLLVLQPGFKRLPQKIDVRIPAGIEMDSYPGPLGQVVSNIVSNAMLHAFEGLSTGIVVISAGTDNGQVRLNIEDDGIGMSDTVRQRAFDPFFTTKFGKGGSGLGLHIAFNIVTGVLGGTIKLDSAPGHGCRFVITIPKNAPDRPESERVPESAKLIE